MSEMPHRLRLRDTGLHDDQGGMGQRIYTTAGFGYEKTEYLRASWVRERLETAIAGLREDLAQYRAKGFSEFARDVVTEIKTLQALKAELCPEQGGGDG